MDSALRFSSFLRNETSAEVWQSAASHLYALKVQIRPQTAECNAAFDRYVLQLTSESYRYFGWEKRSGESSLVTQIRSLLIRMQAVFGNQDAIKRVNDLMKDPKSIDVDLRASVYNSFVQYGGDSAYATMKTMYERFVLNIGLLPS